MNLDHGRTTRKKRISDWLSARITGLHERDAGAWRYAIAAMWAVSSAAVGVTATGMPTGLGTAFDVVAGVALNTIGLPIASLAIAALLAFAGAKLPRVAAGSLLYTGTLFYFILYYSEFGWASALAYAAAFALLVAGAGLLVGVAAKASLKGKALLFVLTASVLLVMLGPGAERFRSTETAADAGGSEVRSLTALPSDPSQPGDYAYRYYTYGNGEDRHRSEFGQDADWLSASVDGSDLIDKWPWLRAQFWGFDETSLPLNGRVWLPEGSGPYPLVLMIHGNHLMEKFSDGGYGYLGEMLASRGFAAVSVDENFLNYSVWSGIPNNDMKSRAWILLQHIRQLQSFAGDSASPLGDRIDFGRIALLGHSRGGQAAAMAADAERWFGDDMRLPESGSYAIEAVIALAPTDTAVDGEWTELRDVSYLTLHGAKDADLVNFYGDRQYGRVSFPNRMEAFKASLYIEDANHSQFNTEWGRTDNSMPTGLFVRPRNLLEPEQQRQIAKVYVSAFLEAVFHRSGQYEALFRDYRAGMDYLPDTRYFNQYESGDFRPLADFSGDDRSEPSPGVTAEATDLTDWRHSNALNRQGQGKADKGVELGWMEEGAYTIRLEDEAVADLTDEDVLMFSLANRGRELEAELDAYEEPEELEALEEAIESTLSIDIELEDRSGNAARLPLDAFMEAEPQVATEFTWLPGLESVLADGKYKDTEEPVYQTYELPLREFVDANPDFDPAEWIRITFHFTAGPGKVMLDNLGWMGS